MLGKRYVTVQELDTLDKELRVVVKVESVSEIELAFAYFKKSRQLLRGICGASSLLRTIDFKESSVNYISVELESLEDVFLMEKIFSLAFVEVIIPWRFLESGFALLDQMKGAKRVIINFTGVDYFKGTCDVDLLFSELVLRKFFPLTKGLAFCFGRMEHAVEFYESEWKNLKKPVDCGSCLFANECSYNGNGQGVKPFIEKEKYNEAWEFLHGIKSSATRF